MWKLKPSPRTLRAAEKYVASLGRKHEELTEEQWKLLVKYVQVRRIGNIFFPIFCLASAVLMFANWHLGHKYFNRIVPEKPVKITFDEKKEQIISPEEIRNYVSYVTERYFMAGTNYIFTVGFLVFFILNATLIRITNKKTHRILLSRPATTEIER